MRVRKGDDTGGVHNRNETRMINEDFNELQINSESRQEIYLTPVIGDGICLVKTPELDPGSSGRGRGTARQASV